MTTVVMAHGAFCGAWAFERFRTPFEARGWNVLTPDLRGHGEAAATPTVAGLSMEDYAADLARTCEGLAEPPVLVGHSLGGLVCQMAARRVRPQAMVLLAPSPPWGVTGSSVEEAVTAAAVGLLDPFWSGTVPPDRQVMARHSLDRVPEPYRGQILARIGPESARALREVLNWWLDPFMTTSVGAGALPAPALVIGGAADVVHPAATSRRTAERIGAAYREMPGMSHWLIGEPGWEDVAALALDWLEDERRAAA
jgi:pimeloyl-ACP methyl ester carboxylesterase